MDRSLPGSSVHGILQARILEWVVTPSSRGLPGSGIKPASFTSPALARRFFTTSATWEALLINVFPANLNLERKNVKFYLPLSTSHYR